MRANKQIVQSVTALLRAIAEMQNATALLRVIAEMADAAVAAGNDVDMRKCIEALTRAAELIGTAVSPPAEVAPPPSYDPRTRQWKCSKCGKFTSASKRSVSHHMRACEATSNVIPLRAPLLPCVKCGQTFESSTQLRGHLGWCGKRNTVIHTCIAPGCRCRAKGPRFHFLCKKHMKATTRQILRWRGRRKAAAEAAVEKSRKAG
jgi:hypothetical protein